MRTADDRGFSGSHGKRAVIAAVCMLAGGLGGCASAHMIRVPAVTTGPGCQVPVPERDVLVGVALSGGGSRAALFAAAGLEALARLRTRSGASALEQVSYVSSVSGGSLAASYYALKKPPRDVPMLTPDGELTFAYRAFFEQARIDLSQDFERQMVIKQLLAFRWLNSFLFARSLSEVLRDRLLGDASMMDLSAREARGDSPGLIVNTTLYNNGRRLALTTLSPDAFRYDLLRDLRASLERRGRTADVSPVLVRGWESLWPLTPLDLQANPCPMSVAGGVTASASFPPVIGPITLQVGGQETYWHAGDGGLYENQGVESLVFLFLKRLQEGKVRRVLLLAFDGAFPFSVGDRRLNQRSEPFSLLSFDFSRVPSIMEERATTWRTLFFRGMQLEGVFPDDRTFRVIPLRHGDARWRDDVSDLPSECRSERPPLASPKDIVQRIAEIPTRLRVTSACDRALLATAAANLVDQHRDAILEPLDARETAGPPADPSR